ncbi:MULTISPECIES: hypothetical protein [unclassified Pseudomonas]|uniref:hypothetical protein n=1 Tax=unclassified Pseudomonas TaxID=196821 RepID=UPI000A1E7A71|nr:MULTISPECIES: hypothetical protein [unclassified Pseudomonas]
MTASLPQSSMLTPASLHGKKAAWLAHAGPALLTVLFIWLPFGFSLTGLLEEWGVIGLFSRIGVFFLTDATSAMPAHALRPLTILPHAIAYALDPDTFNYWHVLLIIALVIKGCCMSLITTRITGSLKWGMLASVLVILFPADTMQLSFRSIHINWALSLTLMACVLLLQALEQRGKARAFALSALASLLLAAGCAMYEVALLLAAIPAFAVFIQVGFKGLVPHIKRHYPQHLIWAVGPVAYIAYVIHTLPLVHSYQSAVVGDSAFASLKQYFPKLWRLGIGRSLFGGWIDALQITVLEIGSHWYIALASAAILGFIALLSATSAQTAGAGLRQPAKPMLAGRMILAGCLLICLGYLPFIFNPAHMGVSQRTFLYAAPGAVLVFIAALLIVRRHSRAVTAALAALMVFTGLGAQLFQFQHYIDISKRQQSVLSDIVHNFDGNALNKTLIILDHSNELNHDWMFLNADLSAVLFHLYGKPVDAIEVCYMPGHEWQQSDPLQRKGRCEETEEGWTLHYPVPLDADGQSAAQVRKLPRSQVVTVDVGNGATASASPELQAWRQTLESGSSPTATRLQGIAETGAAPRFGLITFRHRAHDEYHWDFGKWWSLAPPMAGSGWRETEWETRRFRHNASAWINAPRASLVFDLTPASTPYVISGAFNSFANDQIRTQMQIRVNGHPVAVRWGANGEFSGDLPPQTLEAGHNTLEFISSVDAALGGISARLDWVKIAKAQ